MFKQKTAYEMRISDWSSDVCSSDLLVDTGYFPFPASRGFDCPGYFHHIVIVEIQTRNRITGFGISRFFFNGKNTSIIGEFDYPKPPRILDLIAEHRSTFTFHRSMHQRTKHPSITYIVSQSTTHHA